jgi:ferredoxin-NADP reductase
MSNLLITLGKVAGGEVSTFMHDHMQVGDQVELSGPIGGHFNWTPEDSGPVLLLAGGTGVTPFMSMLRHRAAVGSQVPVTLAFSAKHREDLLFFDELLTLAGRRDGFTLKVTLTREAAPHPFRAGRIDARFIAEAITAMGESVRLVLVCGSDAFVETAAEAAVSAGVNTALIKTERFGS